jgi:exocyst complex protein 7
MWRLFCGPASHRDDDRLQTVDYLERLPEVQDAVGAALLTLGDGNWKMGEGIQPGKASKLGEGDEGLVIEHYMCKFIATRSLAKRSWLYHLQDDVIATVTSTLSMLSNAQKRPAFGSIFLLNNVAYLVQRLAVAPQTPALSALLPKPATDLLNSNSRTAKAGYFDSNFSPLLQALTDDPKGGGVMGTGRSSTKDKLTKFYDLLEEVTERHRVAKVLEDDVNQREQIEDEVVRLVLPSLQRFMQKNRDKSERARFWFPVLGLTLARSDLQKCKMFFLHAPCDPG